MNYLVISSRPANSGDFVNELRHNECGGGVKDRTINLSSGKMIFQCVKCNREFLFRDYNREDFIRCNFHVENRMNIDGSKLEKVERMVDKSNGVTTYSTLVPMEEIDIVRYHYPGCQVTPMEEAVKKSTTRYLPKVW